MITKESNAVKKCCLYASDFHLEMILLPYIREKIDKSSFIIITQNDLSDTIKILLNRVNIKKEEKQKILNLNWNRTDKFNLESIKKIIKKENNTYVIINGEFNYIEDVNKDLRSLENDINIIDCYNINDIKLNIDYIKNNYKEILNTSKI